jgi:prophage regulatory protein
MHASNYEASAGQRELGSAQVSERTNRAAALLREALSLLSSVEQRSFGSLTPPDRLIRLPDVERLAGLRRSAIYERIQRGAFPRSVKVGKRSATWSEAAVQAWIADRVTGRPS